MSSPPCCFLSAVVNLSKNKVMEYFCLRENEVTGRSVPKVIDEVSGMVGAK